MKQITPFKNKQEAVQSLDNGGRFYHIQSKANDGVISKAELGKVGGVFNDKQKMILFLEMSTSFLTNAVRRSIISLLDEKLSQLYTQYKPQLLLPSEAEEKGALSSNVMVTGIPYLIESKSEFTGMIMFPIISGSITTFMMIPLIEEYEIYELKDDEKSETFLLAHTKGTSTLPPEKMVVGGVLKEMQSSDKKDAEMVKFLEGVYYMTP